MSTDYPSPHIAEPRTEGLRDAVIFLTAGAALLLLALLWPVLVLAPVLLLIGRLLGRRRFLAYGVLLVTAAALTFALDGFHTFLSHAPVWRAWSELQGGRAHWVAAVTPVSLLLGSWLAVGADLWLSAPVNHSPAPNRRGVAFALTLLPLWAFMRVLYRRLASRKPERAFRLGRSGLRPVVLHERDLLEHAVIFGATGSGKTNTLRLIASQAITAGWPVVVLDLKGDLELANDLERTASGRASYALVTIEPDPRRAAWNPIASGSANARADRLIVGKWTEEHYERTARDFARTVLSLLDLIGETSTVPSVVTYLEQPDLLLSKARAANKSIKLRDEGARFAQLLAARKKDRSILSATDGLAARLREISKSDLRGALAGETSGTNVDLAHGLSQSDVVCFSLNSGSDPEVAALAGSLALRDIQYAISQRTEGSSPALLLVDEFSVLESDEIKNLLARARAKRVGVVLSTQSLADLSAVDLHLLTQTLSNTATKIIHRLGGNEEPEVVAGLAGTQTVEELTHQVARRQGLLSLGHVATGAGSARQVEEYVLHPNRLRALKRGRAAVILRGEPQWAGFAQIDEAARS